MLDNHDGTKRLAKRVNGIFFNKVSNISIKNVSFFNFFHMTLRNLTVCDHCCLEKGYTRKYPIMYGILKNKNKLQIF